MKKEKVLLISVFILFLSSNLFWCLKEYRTINREAYYTTYDCEQKELIYSLRIFQIGISYVDFNTVLANSNLSFTKKWEKENELLIEVKNILSPCPISGRSYCGIHFEFKNRQLTNIKSGYPCH